MTRKKVKLAWIANDSARKASLKKRRVGVMKKVGELCILCDVNACIVIYSPDEDEPMVWPSVEVVLQMLYRFRNTPEIDRNKKMMNQESYLRERSGKTQEQLKKNQKKNQENEMANLMRQVHESGGFNEIHLGELYNLAWLIEEKMKSIGKRLEFLNHITIPPTTNPLPPTRPPTTQVTYDQTHQKEVNKVSNLINTQVQDIVMGEPWMFNIMNKSNNVGRGFNNTNNGPMNDDIKVLAHQTTYIQNSNSVGAFVGNNNNQRVLQTPFEDIKFSRPSYGFVDITKIPVYESFKNHVVMPVGNIGQSSRAYNNGYPIKSTLGLLQPPEEGRVSDTGKTTILNYGHFFGSGSNNIRGASSNMGQQIFFDANKPWPMT